MRGVLSSVHPSFERLLVIESGPREVTEVFLKHLYEVQRSERVDLLTCYVGAPQTFDSQRGVIYSVHDADAKANRTKFIRKVLRGPYNVVAILCTGDPVLTKWKWIIALRVNAKVLIVNEYAGFFLLDLKHRRPAQMMLRLRLGLHRPVQFHLFGELLLVPFTMAYLAFYAAAVHTRKYLRSLAGPKI